MDNIITNVDGVKVKVRVYDFGDEVADRYTIVYVNKNIKDGTRILKFHTTYWKRYSLTTKMYALMLRKLWSGD